MDCTFYSELSPEECFKTLAGDFYGQKGKIGYSVKKVPWGSHIYLFQLWKRTSYSNPFSPIFYGKIRPHRTGSLIEGRFNMHWFVKVFVGFWFLIIFALLGRPVLESFSDILTGYGGGDVWGGLFCGSFIFGTGAFWVVMGRYGRGRREERYLRDVLIKSFEKCAPIPFEKSTGSFLSRHHALALAAIALEEQSEKGQITAEEHESERARLKSELAKLTQR